MIRYIRDHEQRVRTALAGAATDDAWPELRALHQSRLTYLQHERLAHLHVTLAVGLYALLFFLASLFAPTALLWTVTALFVVLEGAYLIHYYHLENSVQRWYRLADEIAEHLPQRTTGTQPVD